MISKRYLSEICICKAPPLSKWPKSCCSVSAQVPLAGRVFETAGLNNDRQNKNVSKVDLLQIYAKNVANVLPSVLVDNTKFVTINPRYTTCTLRRMEDINFFQEKNAFTNTKV